MAEVGYPRPGFRNDVLLVSKIRTGTCVQGREDVARFIADFVAPSLYDAAVELYTPLDDDL